MDRYLKIIFAVISASVSLFIITCCIKKNPPAVTISDFPEIKPTTAIVVANVVDEGGSPVTSKGICWNIEGNPTIFDHRTSVEGNQKAYENSLSLLSPNSTYYLRAYATNSEGVGYSNQFSLTTPVKTDPPSVEGMLISYTMAAANIRGTIISDGGADVTSSGVCWSTDPKPALSDKYTVDEASEGEFISRITGLKSNMKYYARVYAKNAEGTSYGDLISFTTLPQEEGKVRDIDGNVYNVLSIGNQQWLIEDLRTTRFNNGDVLATTPTYIYNISGEDKPKYQWPCGWDESKVEEYRRMYTWYAATDDRGVCPAGFRVPSDDDWHKLVLFLDPGAVLQKSESSSAGGKLKEQGLIHWGGENLPWGHSNINIGATDEAGFRAIPYLTIIPSGTMKIECYWWTSTMYNGVEADRDKYAYGRGVFLFSSEIVRSEYGGPGSRTVLPQKIRCVK